MSVICCSYAALPPPPGQRQSCKQTALWRNAGLCDLTPRVLLQSIEFSWNSPPHAAPPRSSTSPSLRPHRVEKNTPLSPNTTASSRTRIYTNMDTQAYRDRKTDSSSPFLYRHSCQSSKSLRSIDRFSPSTFEVLWLVTDFSIHLVERIRRNGSFVSFRF